MLGACRGGGFSKAARSRHPSHAGRPRSALRSVTFLAVEDAADKGGLRNLLEVVSGHAYEPHAERYRWIPTIVDDPIKIPIGDRANEVAGRLVYRIEVAERSEEHTSELQSPMYL